MASATIVVVSSSQRTASIYLPDLSTTTMDPTLIRVSRSVEEVASLVVSYRLLSFFFGSRCTDAIFCCTNLALRSEPDRALANFASYYERHSFFGNYLAHVNTTYICYLHNFDQAVKKNPICALASQHWPEYGKHLRYATSSSPSSAACRTACRVCRRKCWHRHRQHSSCCQ